MENKTLSNVLIALQKTISRVNRDTSKAENPKKAIAFIKGEVGFSLTCSCDIDEDELIISDKGSLSIDINGIIDPDIGIKGVGNE